MELRWGWKSSTRSLLRVKHVSSTYLFQKWGGVGGEGGDGGRNEGSGLYIFHFKVGYHYRKQGTHGCGMDLLVKRVVKGKICGIQANSRRVVISPVVSEVQLVREVPPRRR